MFQITKWITVLGGTVITGAGLNYWLNGSISLAHQAQQVMQQYQDNPQARQAIEKSLAELQSLTPAFGAGAAALMALLYLAALSSNNNRAQEAQPAISWFDYLKTKGKYFAPALGAGLFVGTFLGAVGGFAWTATVNETLKAIGLPAESLSLSAISGGALSSATAALLASATMPAIDVSLDAVAALINYCKLAAHELSLEQAKSLIHSLRGRFCDVNTSNESELDEDVGTELGPLNTTYNTFSLPV